jgi:6-phosphogluconolactonase (cycloisomerase 2 family)
MVFMKTIFWKWAFISVGTILAFGLGACSGGTGPAATPPVPQVRFALAGNSDGTVSLFGVDADPGGLRYLGYVKINSSAVQDIAIHPDKPYGYVVTSDGTLTAYSFDNGNGTLGQVNSVAVGADATDILIEPGGKFLYAISENDKTISTYSIATDTGALTAAGAPNFTGADPVRIALAPSGRFAYVVNRTDGSVSIYMRDAGTGALTPSSTNNLGSTPTAIALNKAGTFAYVTYASLTDNVEVFGVDADTGALTSVQTVSAGDTPLDILLDNHDAYAYAANANSDNISVFGVNAGDGKLTFIQNVSSSEEPRRLALDIDNKYLYAAAFTAAEVSAYAVDAGTGNLTPIDRFRARSGLNAIALANGTPAFSFMAKSAFAPDGDVHGYGVDAATGALGSPTATTAGNTPLQVALTPDQRFAYVVNQNSKNISVFQYDADSGALGANVHTVSIPDADAVPYRIAVDPSGRFLYVLDQRSVSGLSGRIYAYGINTNDGALAYIQTRATGRNPENMAIHPAGRYLYTIDSFGDTITLFEIDGTSGVLTQKQTFTPGRTGSGMGRPITMAFHPNGRYVYVTLEDDNEIVRYFINPSNGFLESPLRASTTPVSSDPRPRYISVDPSGLHAYVSHWSGDISTLNIDPGTFALSFASTVAVDGDPSWLAQDPNAHSQFLYAVVTGGLARLTIGSGGALSLQETTGTGTGSSFSRTATIVSVIP